MRFLLRTISIIYSFVILQSYGSNIQDQSIDTIFIENLLEKSNSYIAIDLDSAIYFAKQAQHQAIIINNKLLEQEAKYSIGVCFHKKERFKDALGILLPLQVELIKKKSSPEFKSKMFQKIGECYRDLQQSMKALEYLFMVADILEKEGESKKNNNWLADIYTQIAICYGKSERHEETSIFIKKAMKIHEKYNDKAKLIQDYNNIGYTQFRLGKYEEAEEFLLEGLKLDEENGSLNESLSEMFLILEQNDKSLIYAVIAYNNAIKLKLDGRIKFRKELILSNLKIKELKLNKTDSLNQMEPEVLKINQVESVPNKKSMELKDYILLLLLTSNLILLIILIKRKRQ